MIGERQSDILGLIINHYIKTGEPMGSKTLCELLPYSVSSATIRNEMAFLTELGFLQQRHTSGGRVPTKAAYRYYVERLMSPVALSEYEQSYIKQALTVNAADPERLLKDAANLLCELTGCTAFYSTIKDESDRVQGVDLIPAIGNKAMLVMLTQGGKIKSSVIRLRCELNEDIRRLFHYIVKEFFVGVPLSQIDMSLIRSTAPVLSKSLNDILPVLSSLCSLCREASQGELNLVGQTNLVNQEELGDSIYDLLSFLAEKNQLEEMLEDFAKSKVHSVLLLGNENPMEEMANTAMAVVGLNYYDNQKATLGIISSLRMDYNLVLPRIGYISNICSKLLKEGARYE